MASPKRYVVKGFEVVDTATGDTVDRSFSDTSHAQRHADELNRRDRLYVADEMQWEAEDAADDNHGTFGTEW